MKKTKIYEMENKWEKYLEMALVLGFLAFAAYIAIQKLVPLEYPF